MFYIRPMLFQWGVRRPLAGPLRLGQLNGGLLLVGGAGASHIFKIPDGTFLCFSLATLRNLKFYIDFV